MNSEEERENLELAERYIELAGKPSTKAEDLKGLFDEGLVWREMPNQLAAQSKDPFKQSANRTADLVQIPQWSVEFSLPRPVDSGGRSLKGWPKAWP